MLGENTQSTIIRFIVVPILMGERCEKSNNTNNWLEGYPGPSNGNMWVENNDIAELCLCVSKSVWAVRCCQQQYQCLLSSNKSVTSKSCLMNVLWLMRALDVSVCLSGNTWKCVYNWEWKIVTRQEYPGIKHTWNVSTSTHINLPVWENRSKKARKSEVNEFRKNT